MRRLLRVGLAALLLPAGAWASQIAYRPVSYEDAARQAPIIVYATFERTLDATDLFRVSEVVRGEGIRPKQRLEVRFVGYSEMLMAEQAWRSTGVRRSPLLPRLASGEEPLKPGHAYCLLLDASTPPATYEYAADGAHVLDPACRRAQKALAPPPTPTWPAAVESAALPGFTWQTVHHQTIHARVPVPTGWRVEKSQDEFGLPHVWLRDDVATPDTPAGVGPVEIVFSSCGHGEFELLKKQPTYYGQPVRRTARTSENIVVEYGDADDSIIRGNARGLTCKAKLFIRDDARADTIYRICGGMHPAAPGAWRPPSDPLGDNAGGVIAVPDGAFIDRTRDARAARIHSGQFVVTVRRLTAQEAASLPASLRGRQAYEERVDVETRPLDDGAAFVRRASMSFQGKKYQNDVAVLVARAGWECTGVFPAFVRQPTRAEIDYALALCDTLPRSQAQRAPSSASTSSTP